MVNYPEWLANVVPVSKKDRKVRMCVDFQDLNKASPKDDFSLPHIDILVDNIARHAFPFMDGFSWYNQIKMAPIDMEKTSYITPWGTYCYKVIPFGLKKCWCYLPIDTRFCTYDLIKEDDWNDHPCTPKNHVCFTCIKSFIAYHKIDLKILMVATVCLVSKSECRIERYHMIKFAQSACIVSK